MLITQFIRTRTDTQLERLSREEGRALNREANLTMMPELPLHLQDVPWGHK